MIVLTAQSLSKAHGLKTVIRDFSFGLEDGDRVGVIGVNGCGKSTLLTLLAGLEPTDSGALAMRQGLRIEFLAQDIRFDPAHTVLEHLFSSAGDMTALIRDYEAACQDLTHRPGDAAATARVGELSRRMDAQNAWEYETRARDVLGRLGIAGYDREKIASTSQVDLINSLCALEKPMIYVSFGAPYHYSQIPAVDAFYCGYSSTDLMQGVAAETFLGLREPKGRLPVYVQGLSQADFSAGWLLR